MFRRAPFFFALILAHQAWADRSPYSETRDLIAHGGTLTVRHHHDWSKVLDGERGSVLKFSVTTPFGVDEAVSNLEFRSAGGALVARISSPPLTFLDVSVDGRYVIGLSDIKIANITQLVVFDPSGKLLLRRRISAQVYCLDTEGYLALKRKHSKGFRNMETTSKVAFDKIGIFDNIGWREGENVYLDFLGVGPDRVLDPLFADLFPATCQSPFSPNFTESVTNWISWYQESDPRPYVVERDGKPFEVRLRDPKGIEFGIPFKLTPLEAEANTAIDSR
jgi:hypothetical protein